MSMFRRRLLIANAKINKEPLSNVSVLLTNGNLVNKRDIPSSGYTKDEVVGFAIQGHDHDILVHPDDPIKCYFCGANQTVPGYTKNFYGLINAAYKDFDGEQDTTILCDNWSWNSNWACQVCRRSTWKGDQVGYLGALGELTIIANNIEEINEARIKCGCNKLEKQNYWSTSISHKSEDTGIWNYVFGGDLYGYFDGFNVQGYYSCIPIAKLDK